MNNNDELRHVNDMRIREVREKQYEVWAVTAQRVNAEIAQTETELLLLDAEMALTEYELAEMGA